MLWKRLAPILLATAVLAAVSAAASLAGPCRDFSPSASASHVLRAL